MTAKTPKEILKKHGLGMSWTNDRWAIESIIEAMEEYAREKADEYGGPTLEHPDITG